MHRRLCSADLASFGQIAPVARQLGWRPEFPWARLTGWLDRTPTMRLIERRPMPLLGHFSLIRFGKDALAAAA